MNASKMPKRSGTAGTLYRWSQSDTSLTDAVAWYGKAVPKAAALGWSSQQVIVAVLADQKLLDHDANVVNTTGVFELRVFSDDAELRWLHSSGGLGKAVIIGETDLGLGEPVQTRFVDIIQPLQYLCWGTGTGSTRPGWSQLTEARIGPRWLPVDGVIDGQRAVVTAKEYIGRGSHGNAVVLDERLLGVAKDEMGLS